MNWPEYWMSVAVAVSKQANCKGRSVGAVIVKDGSCVVASGFNRTSFQIDDCKAGGCYRCSNRDKFEPGTGYDLCVCLHAEQSCIIMAAKHGISIKGCDVYTTMKPCLTCAKTMLELEIETVWYMDDWKHPDKQIDRQYQTLLDCFPEGVRQVTPLDMRGI